MQNRPHWEREDRDSRIDRNRQSKRLVFRRSLFLMLVCGVGLFIPLVIQLWTISIRDHDFYQQRATDQQLMDEQVLAGQLVDDAELLGVLGVGAGVAVEDEDLAALQVGGHLALDGVELLAADGLVHLAPGDLIVDALGIHDELVVGRAAGVLAGGDHQRAGLAQAAFAAPQRSLGQGGRGQVAVDGLGADDPVFLNAVGFHANIPPLII